MNLQTMLLKYNIKNEILYLYLRKKVHTMFYRFLASTLMHFNEDDDKKRKKKNK